MVLYVRSKVEQINSEGEKKIIDTTKEYSCCYAQTEIKNAATTASKKLTLELRGGSPVYSAKIDTTEVNKVRTGFANAFKKLAPGSSNIAS